MDRKGGVHSSGTGVEGAARLISGLNEVRDRLGEAVWSELTYAKIFRDSVASTTPVIATVGGRETLLINLSDSCALGAGKPWRSVKTWGGYFDWNQEAGTPAASFAQAVRAVAGPGTLTVGADLPYTRFAALAANGPVTVAGPMIADGPVFVQYKRRAAIEAQWDSTRQADGAAIAAYVGGLRRGKDLLAAMRAPAIGFDPLDTGLSAAGLSALLVTSPYHCELFTGVPAAVAEQFGIACLFRAGAPEIVVFSRQPLGWHDFQSDGTMPSLAAAVAAAVPAEPVGFEGGHLTIGQHAALVAAGCDLREASATFRRWQDRRAGTDLAYFIVAANAVLAGFKQAAAAIERCIAPGLSEREAGAAFDQGAATFSARLGFADRLGPSFDIIHSGERTLLPAIAGDYPLRDGDATIKFDMGVLVRDAFGCVRACSDIARTWSPDETIRAAHDDLRAALVDRLIPAMKPGMTGGRIHALGVEALAGSVPALAAAGLMPQGRGVEGYLRDCGHTLHRTTAGSVYFLPGVSGTIEPGMLGCVEYVWPIGDRILAVEDGYFVTDSEVIPFTV